MPNVAKIGVIGGSGVYNLGDVKINSEHNVSTPFGRPSGKILEGEISGIKCLFLPRHGEGHSISPSEINYRANIYALKELGVRYILSLSAVGSLKEEYSPSTFVLPDQFVDWTKGIRKRSFFESGVVGHVSNANPIEPKFIEMINKTCKELDIKNFVGGTYICIEGPQFSTRAESNLFRTFGWDIIGMTNVPEAFLAKEAGIAYATVGMVTDYDCWKDEACSLEEILGHMKKNNEMARKLIKHLIPRLGKDQFDFKRENKTAIITPLEKLDPDQKIILEILQRD